MLSGDGSFIRSDIPELQNELDGYFDDDFYSEVYELLQGIGIYGKNRPASNLVGWLTVSSSEDGSYCFQQYVTYNAQIWIRYRENGAWAQWCNVITHFTM